jgi:NADH-quinone oxidoreductase subunit N
MTHFTAPHIEYSQLAPVLIVLGVATLGVLVEAFVPRERRYLAQVTLAVLGSVAASSTRGTERHSRDT